MPQVLRRNNLEVWIAKFQNFLMRVFGWDIGPYS
jgi:hypothetical protein